jgi:hypothetical protein
VLSAKGAPSSAAWGNAPGYLDSNPSALKARFIAMVVQVVVQYEIP